MKKRRWTDKQLLESVRSSTSVRQVLGKLGLREAGGNYRQVRKYIDEAGLETAHFTGPGWCLGQKFGPRPRVPMEKILVNGSNFQTFKLKKRLFQLGIKTPICELCGWNKKAEDGRIPLELDHINGVSTDNRIENLRILCPNCHSLQPTHRGLNRKKKA